ncbi:MAG: peroxiredoxin [Candidatus Gastranaerophilaceae bacterium]
MLNFENIELNGLDNTGKEKKFRLSDLKGKNIVLYFYPKDGTSICTKEAENFRDSLKKFPKDTVVIGVSPDTVESHKEFFKKHKLNFHILSDTEYKLAKAFKNLKEDISDKVEETKAKLNDAKIKMKKTFKKEQNTPVTMRSTFIIGKDGKLLKEMRDIDIKGHVDEIVEYIKNIR